MLSRRTQVAALASLLLLAVAAPRLWILRDLQLTSPLNFEDGVNHLLNLDLRWRLGQLTPAQLDDPFLRHHPEAAVPINLGGWPPGVYAVARPWIGPLGPLGLWTTQLTNLSFLALLLAGCFCLGRAVAGLRAGLWAALLAALSPALAAASWYFSLDLPLAAMTTVGLVLLLRTGGLWRRRASLLFGLWSGLGVLVKPAYLMHLLLPTLWVLGRALWRDRGRGRRLALTAGAAAVALATLAAAEPEVITSLASELWLHATSPDNADLTFQAMSPWSLHGALAVPVFLAMKTPYPLLLLSLPGLVMAHQRRWTLPGRGALLGLLWGTYLVLTLLVHRQGRYCLPLQPLVVLLTVWWVYRLVRRGPWRGVVLSAVALAYAAVLVLDHAAPTRSPWDRLPWTWPLFGSGYDELHMPTAEELGRLRRYTYHTKCDLRPLVRGVAALAKKDPSRLTVGIGAALPGGTSSEALTLMVRQELRDRLVVWIDPEEPWTPPPSAVVWVHQPGPPPAGAGGLVPAESVEGTLRCQGSPPHSYTITRMQAP